MGLLVSEKAVLFACYLLKGLGFWFLEYVCCCLHVVMSGTVR